jgi:hypothetical protein
MFSIILFHCNRLCCTVPYAVNHTIYIAYHQVRDLTLTRHRGAVEGACTAECAESSMVV